MSKRQLLSLNLQSRGSKGEDTRNREDGQKKISLSPLSSHHFNALNFIASCKFNVPTLFVYLPPPSR